MGKEGKKNTSLRLETKVLKELKIIAIKEDTSVQAIVESLITNYLHSRKKQKKKAASQ